MHLIPTTYLKDLQTKKCHLLTALRHDGKNIGHGDEMGVRDLQMLEFLPQQPCSERISPSQVTLVQLAEGERRVLGISGDDAKCLELGEVADTVDQLDGGIRCLVE